jgi:hypothetical protein
MTDVLDVLIAARAEVEKGWTQYTLSDGTGNVCAVGAVYRAAGDHDLFGSPSLAVFNAAEAARDVLEGALAGWHLPSFNDHPSTTKADVLALFDRAIAAEAVKVSPDPSHTYTTAT